MSRALRSAPALLVAALLLGAGIAWVRSVLGHPWQLDLGDGCSPGVSCMQLPELAVGVGILATGTLGAWGALTRRPHGFLAGAAAFLALWLGYSAYVLTHRHGQPLGHELASTVRQHAAFLVLIGGAYVAGARAFGWQPTRFQRGVLGTVAALLAAVGLAGFVSGVPYRSVPGTLVPLAIGALACAAALYGRSAHNGAADALAALLLLAGATWGAFHHVSYDPDTSVAIVSYGGPAGLAVLPAVALLLGAAGRPLRPPVRLTAAASKSE